MQSGGQVHGQTCCMRLSMGRRMARESLVATGRVAGKDWLEG